MDIVIAPDSFKGSMTSIQAAKTMRGAVEDILPDANVTIKPMADGGEGTLDTMLASDGGNQIQISCTGPLGEKQETSYGILNDKTAVIEYASIAGLTQVPESKRNPDQTTSYGIGEVITDALDRGCTSIVLGLGGSATNDGGLGMLQALGMRAKDKAGKRLGSFGKDLMQISSIDLKELDPRLSTAKIQVASDVDNPLCGPNGASAIYSPQKGADQNQVKVYDRALEKYSDLMESALGTSLKNIPGAGAAGGLGFALLALGGELVSGAKLIARQTKLEDAVKQADLVLTGEGQSDEQTLFGKAPGYVAELANSHQVPAVLISGSLNGDMDALRKKFAGCFSVVNRPISLEASMKHAERLLLEQVKQVMHFWHSAPFKR